MKLERRGLCNLCLQEKLLRESHIFPRSYFKSLKADNGQLINVVADEDTKPRKLNSDPKEHLLCQECERSLSKCYEEYGTRLFKKDNDFSENSKSITYNKFDYKTFYLYLISILWRASISSLDEFVTVNFPKHLNELLRQSLLNKSIKINDSIRIDDFIKISVLKIIDKSGVMAQDVINKVFISINVERGRTPKDGLLFYFMVDGHLISYHLRVVNSVEEGRFTQIAGQLKNGTSITIPKVDIGELKQVHESFSSAQRKFEKYGRL